MITCRELIDFLSDYLDDALPAAERAAFDEHLAACPDCQAYLKSYKQTIALSKAAFARADDDPPPANVPPELLKSILALRSCAGRH